MTVITCSAMTEKLYTKGVRAGFFGKIPQNAIKDKRTHALEIGVLAFISSFSSGKNECFMKRDTALSLLDLSKPRFMRAINNLRKFGYLQYKQINRSAHSPTLIFNLIQKDTKFYAFCYQSVTCSSLSLEAKALYLTILSQSAGNKTVQQPREYLANYLGMSERSVQKYLDELYEAGLIDFSQSRDPLTHRFLRSEYTIIDLPVRRAPRARRAKKAEVKKPSENNEEVLNIKSNLSSKSNLGEEQSTFQIKTRSGRGNQNHDKKELSPFSLATQIQLERAFCETQTKSRPYVVPASDHELRSMALQAMYKKHGLFPSCNNMALYADYLGENGFSLDALVGNDLSDPEIMVARLVQKVASQILFETQKKPSDVRSIFRRYVHQTRSKSLLSAFERLVAEVFERVEKVEMQKPEAYLRSVILDIWRGCVIQPICLTDEIFDEDRAR